MKKKILFFAAALLGICNAYAVVKWDGTSSTKWTNGMGTEASPYLIETPAHLAYLSAQVKAGNTYYGVYFKQTEDFNLDSKTWTPIGTDTYQFSGIYDGGNKTVSNIKASSSGLFGSTYYARIANVTITGSSYCLIGKANGITNITNCHNKATSITCSAGLIYTVSGSATLTKCSNQAEINSNSTYIGGLVAKNEGDLNLTECFNTAAIKGTQSSSLSSSSGYYCYVGGLVGYSSGIISCQKCYNIGDISASISMGENSTKLYAYAAGLIAYMLDGSNKVEQCYNTSSVTSYVSAWTSSGSVATQIANGSSILILACYARGTSNANSGYNQGYTAGRAARFSQGTIESCYYTGGADFNGSNCYHNQLGNSSAHSIYKSDIVMKSETIIPLLNTLGDYFTMDLEGINDGYPILKWQADTRYTIAATCDANRGVVTGSGDYPNGYTATLKAVPKSGCTFVGWSDGNTENPRMVSVTGDATYTAQFTKSSYTIYINQDCTSNIE